jgi:hypothetical protein
MGEKYDSFMTIWLTPDLMNSYITDAYIVLGKMLGAYADSERRPNQAPKPASEGGGHN